MDIATLETDDYKTLLAHADDVIKVMMEEPTDDDTRIREFPRIFIVSLIESMIGDARADLVKAEEKYKETSSYHWANRKSTLLHAIRYMETAIKRMHSTFRYSEIRHRVAQNIFSTAGDLSS